MFNEHFYHHTVRSVVSVFGSLFNNLKVVRTDSNNNVLKNIDVPLAYGPRQKFLSRIDQQNNFNDPKVAIKLPRMSFELTSMQYDGTGKLGKMNRETISTTNTGATNLLTPVMYRIGLQLSVIAKNQDDALQVLEQILPYFQPDYTVTIKQVEDNFSHDIPFVLNGISISDDYEGDYMTRRALVYTLDFEARVRFYSGTNITAIINRTITDIRSSEDNTLTQRQTIIANPIGDPVDDGDVTVTNAFDNPPNEVQLTVDNPDVFSLGDKVLGLTSLTNGVVVNKDANVLRVVRPDGLYTDGEVLSNLTTGQSANIVSIANVF